jgi:hypothetical protein
MLVIAAAVAVGSLAGCTGSQSEDEMDFYQARTAFLAVLDSAQAEVPGEWESSEPGSVPCRTPGGAEGANMFTHRSGPGVPDGQQHATLERIAAILDEVGYPLTITQMAGPSGAIVEGSFPASGTHETGVSVSVIVSPNATTISGTSPCGTGNSREINHDRQENGGYPGE